MADKFNDMLVEAYHRYKDQPHPPIRVSLIKDYLEFKGVNVDEEGSKG